METYLLNKIKRYRAPLTNVTDSSFSISLANTPYLLPASAVDKRQYLILYNGSGTIVYVGGSTVTTTTGTPVGDGKYMIIPTSEGVYVCCGSGSRTIRLLELS